MSCKENSFSLHFSPLHLHSLPRFLFVAKKKLLLPNKKENLHKVNTHTDTGKIAITLARYLLLAAPSLASLLFSCSVGPCLNSCRHQSSNAFKILRCCCNFIADTRERSNVVVVECLLFLCCAGYTLTKKVLTGSTRLGWRTRKKTEYKKTAEIVLGKSFAAQVEKEKHEILLRCAATIYKVNETWGVHKVK